MTLVRNTRVCLCVFTRAYVRSDETGELMSGRVRVGQERFRGERMRSYKQDKSKKFYRFY